MESTTVQDFLQHLLQNEVVDCGILKDLKVEEIKEKKKTKDPRITMELRHKQVRKRQYIETDIRKHSFYATYVDLWNSLPHDIIDTNSLEHLSKGLGISMNEDSICTSSDS